MPFNPISLSASFTSSSLNGLMMASIFFMSFPPDLRAVPPHPVPPRTALTFP
jgi:hypothetical protein